MPPPYGIFPHTVESVSKQMYQGKLCSQLVGVGSETLPDPCYLYTQNDSVFFYSNLSDRFELLYDFGAGVGDSWTIGGLGIPVSGWDSLRVTVDSLSQTVVNGDTLRVWHISYPLIPFEWGNTIIEKVGNTCFLGPDYGLFEGGPCGLRCYADPMVDLHFVSFPCDTILGLVPVVEPEAKQGLRIMPNPTTGIFQVQLPDEIGEGFDLLLYDATGRLHIRQHTAGGIQPVQAPEHMPSGVYFLCVFRETGQLLGRERVVVE